MPHPRRAIPLEQWPEGDRILWAKANENADPLFEPGGAAHWRPKTRRTVMTRYGLWLAWLLENGLLDPSVSPAERVTRERLAEYLEYLHARGLAPITIAGLITNLHEAIRVMEPQGNLSLLKHVLTRLSEAESSRDKRLRVVSPALLLKRAVSEMRRLHNARTPSRTRRTAGRYRDAFVVAFLATRPIRLENVSAIELGRHLTKVGDRYWCRFSPTETKEGRPLEFPMPASLTPWLDHYLSIYLPLLLRGRQRSRLWISIRSTPMDDNSVYYSVVRCTERLIGKPINPHLFRDCVATIIAELAPKEVRIISKILRHSNLSTVEDYYNQAGMLSAGRRYHEALEEFRGEPG
jgi:integrase